MLTALLLLLAQWLDYPAKNIPRTKDGKPVLTAKAPRTRDGRPDLSGIWLPDNTPGIKGTNGEPLPKYFISVTFDLKDEMLLTPAGLAALRHNDETNQKDDPTTRCHPIGVPASDTVPIPYKIVQTPGLVVILNEGDTAWRQVFTDGRKHAETTIPSWMGYSVGHWDGDTLVVETTGFNDKSWLDGGGHPHSEALHVVERYTPDGPDHINYQAVIEDPKVFTRPWSMSLVLYRHKEQNFQLLEYACDAFDVEKYYP